MALAGLLRAVSGPGRQAGSAIGASLACRVPGLQAWTDLQRRDASSHSENTNTFLKEVWRASASIACGPRPLGRVDTGPPHVA